MRNTPSLITLCLGLIISVSCGAQSWQWGRGNACSAIDGWAVATDNQGNVYAGGINTGGKPSYFGTYQLPNVGGAYSQCAVAKYDKNGNFLWAIGTQGTPTAGSYAYLINITTDPNNNLFILGSFTDASVKIGTITLTKPGSVDAQYFLAKVDPNGHVLWATNTGNAQYNYLLVAGFCYVLSTGALATDQSGNAYITANFHYSSIAVGSYTLTNADPTGSTYDILLAKYDANGNLLWAKSAGGNKSENAYGLTVTPAGDIYIAGVFSSPSVIFGPSVITNSDTASQAFIARFDNNGNATWADSSGGMGKEYAIGLAADYDNNVYLTGGFKDTAISFSGTTIRNPDSGRAVMYLAKFDPSNNVAWYKTIWSVDSNADAWGYSVTVSECDRVWAGGVITGKVNIDSNILPIAPGSCADPVFIAGYTLTGNYLSSAAMLSGGDDQVGVACDTKNGVFLCSDYACTPFMVAADSFSAVLGFNNTDDCYNGGELMYVAKYTLPDKDSVSLKTTSTVICPGSSITLSAPAGFGKYVWNNGTTAATCNISDSGTYWVDGINNCFSFVADTFFVAVDCDCARTLFVPNTFTPNGDGLDDIFYPRTGNAMKLIKSFRVYNRWGELIFERDNIAGNDASNAWDGSYRGNPPISDVYVWVVEAECENGAPVSKKGSVTIIR